MNHYIVQTEDTLRCFRKKDLYNVETNPYIPSKDHNIHISALVSQKKWLHISITNIIITVRSLLIH